MSAFHSRLLPTGVPVERSNDARRRCLHRRKYALSHVDGTFAVRIYKEAGAATGGPPSIPFRNWDWPTLEYASGPNDI